MYDTRSEHYDGGCHRNLMMHGIGGNWNECMIMPCGWLETFLHLLVDVRVLSYLCISK